MAELSIAVLCKHCGVPMTRVHTNLLPGCATGVGDQSCCNNNHIKSAMDKCMYSKSLSDGRYVSCIADGHVSRSCLVLHSHGCCAEKRADVSMHSGVLCTIDLAVSC